jgi:hypothetical protein
VNAPDGLPPQEIEQIARRHYARYRRHCSLELADLVQAGYLAALEDATADAVDRAIRRLGRSEDLRARREIPRAWLLGARGKGAGDEALARRLDLRRALAKLSRHHFRLVRWFWYEGLTEKEIAGRTGQSEAAVRSRLAVALAQLRRRLLSEIDET